VGSALAREGCSRQRAYRRVGADRIGDPATAGNLATLKALPHRHPGENRDPPRCDGFWFHGPVGFMSVHRSANRCGSAASRNRGGGPRRAPGRRLLPHPAAWSDGGVGCRFM